MAKIERYDGNVQAFASEAVGTERTIFGEATQSDSLSDQLTPDYLRGWGIVGPSSFPTLEDFSAAFFTSSQFIAYLHQVGMAEWNDEQEYNTNSLTNYSGVIYRSLVDDNIGNTPDLDDGNWENLQGEGIENKLDKSGVQSVAGTAIFTNSTNNINLTDIGLQGWEVGDVIEIIGSTSNDKLFTIESITDDDNVVVNYEHRGGTTSKSLVDETAAVTCSLVCKWYLAPVGLGQDWCEPASSRVGGIFYTNSTRRSIDVSVTISDTGTIKGNLRSGDTELISEIFIATSSSTEQRASLAGTIAKDSKYKYTSLSTGDDITRWMELR